VVQAAVWYGSVQHCIINSMRKETEGSIMILYGIK